MSRPTLTAWSALSGASVAPRRPIHNNPAKTVRVRPTQRKVEQREGGGLFSRKPRRKKNPTEDAELFLKAITPPED